MNASLFAEFAISLNFKIPLDMFSLRFGSDERKKSIMNFLISYAQRNQNIVLGSPSYLIRVFSIHNF